MSDKEPKRWECVECGHVNKKTRTKFLHIDGRQYRIYVCYKCSGKIRETDEWTAWHERMRERTKPAMMAMIANRVR